MADETGRGLSEAEAVDAMADIDFGIPDPSPTEVRESLMSARDLATRQSDNVRQLRPEPQRGQQNRDPGTGQYAEGRQPQQVPAKGPNEAPSEETIEADTAVETEAEPAGRDDFLEFEAADEGGEPERIPLSTIGGWRNEIVQLKRQLDQQRRDSIPPDEWDRQINETARVRHQLLQTIETLEQMILPPPPDTRLLDPNNPMQDTAAYFAQQQAYAQAQERLRQVKAIQQAQQAQQADVDKTLKKSRVDRETDKLTRAWPEVKDKAVQQAVFDEAQRYGFSAQEIADLTDHRQLLVLRDAMAYRKVMAQRQAAVKVVRKTPKLVRQEARGAQTRQAQQFSVAATKLSKTGSMEDAEAALGALGF